jgi:hypothetical protein
MRNKCAWWSSELCNRQRGWLQAGTYVKQWQQVEKKCRRSMFLSVC